jgi:TfoX/Sxy family transcriptional regulator of competence genes
MASDRSFVDYVCEQVNLPGRISYRKMFGEYAIYLDDRVVALVCDNQLFVKPTVAGRAILGAVSEHPPYPGAKPHFRIVDELDDAERLKRLLVATVQALPIPKAKQTKAAKKRREK